MRLHDENENLGARALIGRDVPSADDSDEMWDGTSMPPKYYIHYANPVGSINILSFMDSWWRSTLL